MNTPCQQKMHPEEINIKNIDIIDCTIGKNVQIMHPVNLYGCTIGDDCFIGPFVEIQRNAKIGNKTRVSSHSFICENVEIGENCFIGHGVMFTNDKLTGESCKRPENYLRTVIADNVQIGSNSTLLPVSIGHHSVVGAGSVVTKDIGDHIIVCGNPARALKVKNTNE